MREYTSLEVGLPGRHQVVNALLALRASEIALDDIQAAPAAAFIGLRDVRRLSGLRGRLDLLSREPLVVSDVAHNSEGLAVALAFVREVVEQRQGRLYVLFNAMRDKDAGRMALLLTEAATAVFLVSLSSERALSTDELHGLLTRHGATVEGSGTVREGLAWFRSFARPQDVLLISGSHQVVARVPEEWMGT